LNVIRFRGESDFVVERIPISQAKLSELSASLLLVYTGLTRHSQEVERRKLARMADIRRNLSAILSLVDRAYDVLTGNAELSAFGRLLNDTWVQKRQLDSTVSAASIDALYDAGISAGALGGKLLGAGGGGFMLFFVPPERRENVRSALSAYNDVPIGIGAAGSTIIHT